MQSDKLDGTLLIAPHQFPHLDREMRLADELGVPLVAAPDKAAFRAGMPDAAVVMVTPYARVEAEDFAAMTKCRAVVRYGMGYDNIDVDAAAAAGVPVSIVPGTASEEVASHALAMGLALARRIPQGQAAIRRGEWAGTVGFDTPKLSELTVGVVGLGRIGGFVAQWWQSLGAHVLVHDPFATASEFELAPLGRVLAQAHVVSLHLPLTNETKDLIDGPTLARMRRGVVIVNVSRGGLIDEVALADAVRSGHVAGAGIDTFSIEPLPLDHPLRGLDNVVTTPHVAWRSDRSLDALQIEAVARARLALTGGELPDRVA